MEMLCEFLPQGDKNGICPLPKALMTNQSTILPVFTLGNQWVFGLTDRDMVKGYGQEPGCSQSGHTGVFSPSMNDYFPMAEYIELFSLSLCHIL